MLVAIKIFKPLSLSYLLEVLAVFEALQLPSFELAAVAFEFGFYSIVARTWLLAA